MSLNVKEFVSLLNKGYFAVNKPKNWTSVEVLEELKRILRKDVPVRFQPSVLKLGHGGTLDHTATGVLAVGIGLGCKILPLLLHGDKKYKVTGCFGIATDTYNEVGNVVQEKRYDHITKELLEETIKKFIGKISQMPPKYSALKLHGRRIGDWTREGIDVELQPRLVKCYSIQCFEFSPPLFQLEVTCGGGFYIRSLVHELGQALSSCAHVTALHRTKHGPFNEEDTLEQLQWNGNNIAEAMWKAREKYGILLKKSRANAVAKNHFKKYSLFPRTS